jgi:VanZ family protein
LWHEYLILPDGRTSEDTVSALFPSRRAYGFLATSVIAFAMYASLLPFRFEPRPIASAWTDFRVLFLAFEYQPFSRTNFLANVLLFVPIGFFMMGALVFDRRLGMVSVAAAVIVVAISLVTSLAVEFLQLFTPGRVPSLADIVAQTIGCGIGIVVWFVCGRPLTAWLRAAADRTRHDRVSRMLAAYAVAWTFVNLAPFDITLDVAVLAERVRTGLIVIDPFRDSDVPMARIFWDAAAALVSAIPLGLLGLVAGSGRVIRRRPLSAFVSGAALVLIVEVAQIVIQSHSSESTDVLLGWLGVAIGVGMGMHLFAPRIEISTTKTVAGAAMAGFAAWCVFLFLYHWLPYDFVLDTQAVKGKLDGISLIPFAGYAVGSDLAAFNDLLLKLGLSIPLGGIATFVARQRRIAPAVVTGGSLFAAAAIFALIEMGQFFIPSRTPDPTDVLVGTVGVYLGLWLGRWVRPAPSFSKERT